MSLMFLKRVLFTLNVKVSFFRERLAIKQCTSQGLVIDSYSVNGMNIVIQSIQGCTLHGVNWQNVRYQSVLFLVIAGIVNYYLDISPVMSAKR